MGKNKDNKISLETYKRLQKFVTPLENNIDSVINRALDMLEKVTQRQQSTSSPLLVHKQALELLLEESVGNQPKPETDNHPPVRADDEIAPKTVDLTPSECIETTTQEPQIETVSTPPAPNHDVIDITPPNSLRDLMYSEVLSASINGINVKEICNTTKVNWVIVITSIIAYLVDTGKINVNNVDHEGFLNDFRGMLIRCKRGKDRHATYTNLTELNVSFMRMDTNRTIRVFIELARKFNLALKIHFTWSYKNMKYAGRNGIFNINPR